MKLELEEAPSFDVEEVEPPAHPSRGRAVEPDNAGGELLEMMTGYWLTQAIYVCVRLGIADELAGGARHYTDLARATECEPESLLRLLRALASRGIFAETEPGRFRITPTAALLQRAHPQSMRPLALMYAEEQYEAWGSLLNSVQHGGSGFAQRFGCRLSEYLGSNGHTRDVFNDAMIAWARRVAHAATEAYDFGEFRTLVDVGGAIGAFLAVILQKNPELEGVLFDVPHVVSAAGSYLREEGVAERVRRVGGGLLSGPPPGEDAYLLAQILHSRTDEQCVAILQQVRRAIPAHGKLLLVELVLSPGNQACYGKWLDLHMLVLGTGRQRTSGEFEGLLHRAGFELVRVVETAAGPSILEARPLGA